MHSDARASIAHHQDRANHFGAAFLKIHRDPQSIATVFEVSLEGDAPGDGELIDAALPDNTEATDGPVD